jgi:hypothetical protein
MRMTLRIMRMNYPLRDSPFIKLKYDLIDNVYNQNKNYFIILSDIFSS